MNKLNFISSVVNILSPYKIPYVQVNENVWYTCKTSSLLKEIEGNVVYKNVFWHY